MGPGPEGPEFARKARAKFGEVTGAKSGDGGVGRGGGGGGGRPDVLTFEPLVCDGEGEGVFVEVVPRLPGEAVGVGVRGPRKGGGGEGGGWIVIC
jgi:hypothetical protein